MRRRSRRRRQLCGILNGDKRDLRRDILQSAFLLQPGNRIRCGFFRRRVLGVLLWSLPNVLLTRRAKSSERVQYTLKGNCFCGIQALWRQLTQVSGTGAVELLCAGTETIIAPSNAGTRPYPARPIFSALATASVENSAVAVLNSAKLLRPLASLIALGEQSSTLFSFGRFGCVLALSLVALWIRSVY